MKYATLLLGLAIVLASVIVTQAETRKGSCPAATCVSPREKTKAACEKQCNEECQRGMKQNALAYWFCEDPKPTRKERR